MLHVRFEGGVELSADGDTRSMSFDVRDSGQTRRSGDWYATLSFLCVGRRTREWRVQVRADRRRPRSFDIDRYDTRSVCPIVVAGVQIGIETNECREEEGNSQADYTNSNVGRPFGFGNHTNNDKNQSSDNRKTSTNDTVMADRVRQRSIDCIRGRNASIARSTVEEKHLFLIRKPRLQTTFIKQSRNCLQQFRQNRFRNLFRKEMTSAFSKFQ